MSGSRKKKPLTLDPSSGGPGPRTPNEVGGDSQITRFGVLPLCPVKAFSLSLSSPSSPSSGMIICKGDPCVYCRTFDRNSSNGSRDPRWRSSATCTAYAVFCSVRCAHALSHNLTRRRFCLRRSSSPLGVDRPAPLWSFWILIPLTILACASLPRSPVPTCPSNSTEFYVHSIPPTRSQGW
ncbi:hypothetical protein VTN00DRAFT_1508 [Thermoascus crustaceus]|uniref:uncharacterized protein n=1 Tax=Thermoascus crustaceus TaxID=5088 RepID=UPI0037445A7E